MSMGFCGLDFGTSNSTLGVVKGGQAQLVALEDGKPTLPSALFFAAEEPTVYFGRRAVIEYTEGTPGRLMRALKSLLGSNLIHDTTRLKTKNIAFTEIIGLFIKHLKTQAEAHLGQEINRVVLGRPVQFVDDNPAQDRDAQNQLEGMARAQGFKELVFQYEPIAAALDYEQRVTHEQLAFIIDIGGGTADFSIVRVSPQRAKLAARKDDILAFAGVHIGGTDFDRLLSMAKVMPFLGRGSKTREKGHTLPESLYRDLATWQRINGLYTPKVKMDLRQLKYEAEQPVFIERLMAVIESRQGHALAGKIEQAKVALTDAEQTLMTLKVKDGEIKVPLQRTDLHHCIAHDIERLVQTAINTLVQASLNPGQIQAVFLTGGTTQIPIIKQRLVRLFPSAQVVEGDMFGSVGLGLTLEAQRVFT